MGASLILYVYRGEGTVTDTSLRPQQAAMFQVRSGTEGASSDSLEIELQAGKDGFGVLVFAGRPIQEPIAWKGPIVMNTQGEVNAAYKELRRGDFLRVTTPYDYKVAADRT